MNVYTRAALARVLGCNSADFRPVIAKTTEATRNTPKVHTLVQPVFVGERRPARVVAEMAGGFMLFPLIISLRTAWKTADWWVPMVVDA